MGEAAGWMAQASVLVADDEAPTRTVLVGFLWGMGARDVRIALDSADAVRQVNARPPSLLLLGLDLPRDGVIALDRIRSARNERVRRTPVIMITSSVTPGRVELLRDAGADEILTKPVTGEALASRVRAALLRQRPFVVSSTYRGPDRRRSLQTHFRGPWRRSTDAAIYDIDTA